MSQESDTKSKTTDTPQRPAGIDYCLFCIGAGYTFDAVFFKKIKCAHCKGTGK